VLKKLFLICCCVCAALGAVGDADESNEMQLSSLVREGENLPNVFLHGLSGVSREMADFAGRPLIINVWASWCSPCRAEMASLERLAWMDDLEDVVIIGISTDDSRQRAEDYLSSISSTIPHFIDEGLRLEKMLGATRIPLTVLVNKQGRIVKKVYGARAWDEPALVQMIQTLFAQAKTS
jgi:thiol-disulfide isomerase/thioredoxin